MNFRRVNIIPIKTILIDEQVFGEFNRFDIIVRLLAIEDYIIGDSEGIELYCKMQELRLKEKDFFGIEVGSKWQEFKRLIDKFEVDKYNNSYPLRFNKYRRLVNGSHRLAISLHNNFELISYVYSSHVDEYNTICDYGLEWFNSHNFTERELSRICKRYEGLKECLYDEMYAIIWSPALHNADNIIKLIQKRSFVVSTEERILCFNSRKDNENFIKKVYKFDKISEERLKEKIEYIVDSLNGWKVKIVKIVFFFSNGNDYQKYIKNKNDEINFIKELKSSVRNMVKENIKDYYFDNSFHCGCTYNENLYLKEIWGDATENDFLI